MSERKSEHDVRVETGLLEKSVPDAPSPPRHASIDVGQALSSGGTLSNILSAADGSMSRMAAPTAAPAARALHQFRQHMQGVPAQQAALAQFRQYMVDQATPTEESQKLALDKAAARLQAATRGASARQTVAHKKLMEALLEEAARGSARAKRQLALAEESGATKAGPRLITDSVPSMPTGKSGRISVVRGDSQRSVVVPIMPESGGVAGSFAASAAAAKLLRRPRERHVFTDLQFTLEAEESEFDLSRNDSSFTPAMYIDLETGDRIVTTTQKFFDPKRYRKITEDGIEDLPEAAKGVSSLRGSSKSLVTNQVEGGVEMSSRWLEDLLELSYEVGTGLYVWRFLLKCLMMVSLDQVNSAQITRALQVAMPFFTGYEAFLLDNLISALDTGDRAKVSFWLKIGLRNRNVSRVIVQQCGPRWDFIWHLAHQFKRNRWYDGWGQLPIPLIGITGFPTSENFASSRALVLASIFRVALGSGHYWTRLVTGRESLVTDDPNAAAQNLAAESNGFESANRNQHGTTLGRAKTNKFRLQHRLPTDESIVRSFMSDPLSTMTNNGAEHALRQVGRHLRNMLNQPDGNFAHQLMEQMNPFEFLRFHMPIILLALTSLRGISSWDAEVLAPIVHKLQLIKAVEIVAPTRDLVQELLSNVVSRVCGGVAGRVHALESVLLAIDDSLLACEDEASKVQKIVASVQLGLLAGAELLNSHSWWVPGDEVLKKACLDVCKGRQELKAIPEVTVKRALTLLAPRDKRTLIELCQQGQQGTRPGRLLVKRAATLLKRELRRDGLDEQLRTMSKGAEATMYLPDKSYWLIGADGSERVYRYKGKRTHRQVYIFLDRLSHAQLELGPTNREEYDVLEYVEVAEVISRAQKAFMTIELNHCKKFSYHCWMEFAMMREPLRRLMTLAQTHCAELDDARLNVLSHIQRAAQTEVSVHDLKGGKTYYKYKDGAYEPFVYDPDKYAAGSELHESIKTKKIVSVPPQSLIVVGGGPTGLLTSVHCLEGVLVSDGNLRLYESRDSFQQAGARFERAQVVRLDARWIAMLRYHLGTLFEDIWVPASGETDPHLGNTLPTQNFIEITIKDMESALNVQMVKLASCGLVQHDTNAGAQYDVTSNTLSKKGSALKLNDLVLRKVNPAGDPSKQSWTWKVVKLNEAEPLSPLTDLELGGEYAVWVLSERQVHPFKLVGINIATQTYTFYPSSSGSELKEITAKVDDLPYIYPKGIKVHRECESVVFESVIRQGKGQHCRQTLGYAQLEKQVFQLDTGHCHVAEAIGKPTGSNVHFQVTQYEPYGVACLHGLKVSLGMHNLGTGRFHSGVWDDIRSHTEQNTRVVGDFTKIVNAPLITKGMYDALTKDVNWKLHWEMLVAELGFGVELKNIHKLLSVFVQELRDMAPYQRTHLQTRFFETGDNFYLGMEFTREYDAWKKRTVKALAAPLEAKLVALTDTAEKAKETKSLRALTTALAANIDRLWYDSCLEVIRKGDVYNPGGQGTIPHLYLIDAKQEQTLGSLKVGEAFRTVAQPFDRYEVLVTDGLLDYNVCLVRDIEGHVTKMSKSTPVKRGGNLTRNPGGNQESKVAIATFPVAHYVNHRTMRLNDSKRGYVFAFLGDEQSTPHFMRYSGLTGAAINSMLLNNFITDAVAGVDFASRFKQYSATTNWSNGEVVTRGTGANYGEDGFLRPAFPYKEGVRYLHSKVIEYDETAQDLSLTNYRVGFSGATGAKGSHDLSYDWSVKFAAGLIPRGMEHNGAFIQAMLQQVQKAIVDYFIDLAALDTVVKVAPEELRARAAVMDAAAIERMASAAAAAGVSAARAAAAAALKDGGLHGNLFFDDPDDFWARYLEGLPASAEDKQRLEANHIRVAKRISATIVHVVEFAKRLHDEHQRISTQGVLQHKASDCLVDSFAVEAQDFANSLAMSAALTATSVALNLIPDTGPSLGPLFSLVLGLFVPFIAVGTIANAARYKNRNEEWRVQYADHKYADTLKGIYALMSPTDRKALPAEQDPFLGVLRTKRDKFVKDVEYYNYPEPTDFVAAVDTLIAHMHDTAAIKEFMRLLTTKFLPETYAANGYLAAALVGFYLACEELLRFTNDGKGHKPSLQAANALFERYRLYQAPLEESLERGVIKFGFFKERSLKQNHFVVMFLYFAHALWMEKTRRAGKLGFIPAFFALPGTVKQARRDATACMHVKPLASTTKEVVAQMRDLKNQVPAPSMGRETLDTEALYHATNESYISSFIIAVPGYLTFWAFLFFSIANIVVEADGGVDDSSQQWALNLQRGAIWFAGFISPITATLAAVFLTRKLLLQSACIGAIKKHLRAILTSGKLTAAKEASAKQMQKVVRIGRVQQFVTFSRALAAYAAAAALPWVWVVREKELLGLEDDLSSDLDRNLPFYVAAGSVGLQLIMLLFRYVVEYSILWGVDTQIGAHVTECFAEELASLKKQLSAPTNSVETQQVQETRAWEYVARAFLHKYRFDTIFRANRMGNIMHHIMEGPMISAPAYRAAHRA